MVLLLMAPIGAMAATSQTSDSAASNSQLLKPEQLDQLVAADRALSRFIARRSTDGFGLSDRHCPGRTWLESHKNLKGDQLKTAVAKQDWDDSIKSLVATPGVLKMMSEKLDWTEKLGDAVVAQQPDVMDAIQRLRGRAQANDKLKSTPQQKVTVSQAEGKQVNIINRPGGRPTRPLPRQPRSTGAQARQ